jgi:hypothetical protein
MCRNFEGKRGELCKTWKVVAVIGVKDVVVFDEVAGETVSLESTINRRAKRLHL